MNRELFVLLVKCLETKQVIVAGVYTTIDKARLEVPAEQWSQIVKVNENMPNYWKDDE